LVSRLSFEGNLCEVDEHAQDGHGEPQIICSLGLVRPQADGLGEDGNV
jgi:hypothetical protein